MKTGITFWIGQKDYFVITDQKNRTIPFAIRVLAAIKKPPTNQNAKELLSRMKRVTLEEVEIKNRGKWYKIHGDNFGMCAPAEDITILALN